VPNRKNILPFRKIEHVGVQTRRGEYNMARPLHMKQLEARVRMKIQRMASSFQEIAKSIDAEFLIDSSFQSGLASAEDQFESNSVAKESKLFMDNEIDSAHDSRDIFQIIDQASTSELGSKKNPNKFRYKRIKIQEHD
jgi:hypothetical protein